MIPTDRFQQGATHRQELFQPECPVYVRCVRLCVDSKSGSRFLQMRLVNRTERTVQGVCFRLNGIDRCGKRLYTMTGMILANCNAPAYSAFGEERMFALLPKEADSAQVIIESVSFRDGMLWRRLPEQQIWNLRELGRNWEEVLSSPEKKSEPQETPAPVEQAPPAEEPVPVKEEQSSNPLRSAQEALQELRSALDEEDWEGESPEETFPVILEKPAPILRERPAQEESEPPEEEEEEGGMPRWLVVLLCVLGGVSLLAVAALVVFCIHYGII